MIRIALVTMLAALVAACGGGAAAPSPTPTICPEFPVPAPPTLIYPISGATGVPDGNFTLVIASFNSATPPPAVLVPASGGTSVTSGPPGPAPSPIPTPAATPQPGQTTYGLAIGALAPGTTYNVTFTFGPIVPGCTGPETSGQFTTQ